MQRSLIAGAFAFLAASTANAAVDLLPVPANCGTPEEVQTLLAVNMPSPKAVAKGGNSRGEDVVVLFTGSSQWGSYWALVATVSSEQACVVASGRTWTTIEPAEARAF